MSTSPQFISTPRNPVASFVNGDGTTFKAIFSAASGGSKIESLIGSNSDASNAYVVQLAIQKSSVDYVIGEVSIPIGAGTNGAAKSVAMLNPTDIPGLAYTEGGALYLETGCVLRGRVKSTVSGINTVHVLGVGGDY